MTRRERKLTKTQLVILGVVGNNSPASIKDLAYHLWLPEAIVRGRMRALENRGLVDRQYTGLSGSAVFGYNLSNAGVEALEAYLTESKE